MAQLVKTMAGLAIASVKTVNGLAIASAKTVAGLDNTSGGGTGNAWTLVQHKESSGGSVTLDAIPTAGNLLVACFKWETSGAVTGIACGTDNFTLGTVSTHSNNDLNGQIAYLLASVQTATALVTASGSTAFQRIIVMEFSATGTHSLDAQAAASFGTSTAVASGTASSSVSTGLGIGLYGEYTATAFSSPLIGGSAATASYEVSDTVAWYRTFSSTISSGTAAGTISPSSAWVCPFSIFKSV